MDDLIGALAHDVPALGRFLARRTRRAVASAEPRPNDRVTLSKADMEPGALLFVENRGGAIDAAIEVGQRLTDFSPWRENAGDARQTHVMMWTKRADAAPRTEPFGSGDAEIVHATRKHGKVIQTAVKPGSYCVYAPRDRALGAAAAAAARTWSADRSISYDYLGATQAIVRDATLGPGGEAAARAFARDVRTANPPWAAGGTHCSALVGGAYQGAALDRGMPLRGALAYDMRHVTPRLLEHAVRLDPERFAHAGTLRVAPGERAYEDPAPA